MASEKAVLVVSFTPYFLERGVFELESNSANVEKLVKNDSWWQENSFFLEKGKSIALSFLAAKLIDFGYEKTGQVTFPGEFSVRGGLLDIFPVNSRFALRFEFFGNKIENVSFLALEIPSAERVREILRQKLKTQKLFSGLKDLRSGDYVVHLDHGVAQFRGIVQYELKKGEMSDYYRLDYAQDDRLYVPLGLERKLSRYVGFIDPKISKLGSPGWENTKRKTKEEVERFARELLQIYGRRETALRPAYDFDREIEKRLEDSFLFEETLDQTRALEDIREDLKKEKPMDRIVCGDVGFGKTEIALRIMAQVASSGRQAALLCPTTILAYQHFQNFKERLKGLPIKVALLTRLENRKEQKEVIEALKQGKIDIVVGTHRLLSRDIESSFERLGLLVIDDEQRFGVRQKEKLKKLRTSLDILSLSATPIPRTLYLALSSLRKISLVQTPPAGRRPIKTFVLPLAERNVEEAINQELERDGQIYYLHNRISTIEKTKTFLEKLLPKMKILVVHGRMKEKEMIRAMTEFREKRADLLLATTIIENGLDLPSVNTLVVEDASRLGLAQAYQIRGRIGRFHEQAFAFFLHPKKLSFLAKERLRALKEAEALGSGWQVAVRDLEIRGAGNVLGREQSGHINRIGLNLYCQMLADAVEKQRK